MATKGRVELLQWLNEATECDYSKVETCSDAVAFCQIIDCLHPGIVALTRLNLNARHEEDCARNLKVLQEALNKTKLKESFPYDKMAKGKFQDNMFFLQRLYTYAIRQASPNVFANYPGYRKRLDILEKQRRDSRDMAPHLIPLQTYLNAHQYQEQNEATYQEQYRQEPQYGMMEHRYQPERLPENFNPNQPQEEEIEYEETTSNEKRTSQITDYITDLEIDMKSRMERNWRLMHNLDKVLDERNTLYNCLDRIDNILRKYEDTPLKNSVMEIITAVPDDFRIQ